MIFTCQSVAKLASYLESVGNKGTSSLAGIVILLNQGDETKNKLILAPPAGGTVIGYMSLAQKLTKIGNVYGLQDPRLSGIIPRHKSLAFQELVQMYTEAISEIYRSGIDYIGGHSLGGHLAYAITSELSRQGLSPKGVIILDTVPIHEVAMEKFNIEDDAFKVYVLTAIIGELLNIDPESVKGMSLTKEKQYVLTKAQEDEMFREVMNRS
ncbi:thioesterase domain-containing protein [Brevibacillus laterosporus]|uniref:thioesterase domain-containing protein n=1 Tax=Brevibacillus laterosporus TaxID=1465 RepID=UPI000CE4977F|nr:thioesterase domain-containing protein [Brevibacillus laterosporus]MED1664850.1 thioesterase domain-containing protein [Brevibacillus laterosporus]MED1671432.1 thioesterase domain-containing protein [Brevibacillus laterosporus]MED1717538.1 thioesterase domain-containing protein [Brevibacillus laterosporus]PPA87628.1 hypothetical protein C4A76_11990 [Brevibacillus laterosporus]